LNPGTPGLSGLEFSDLLATWNYPIGDMNGMVLNDVKMMCLVVEFAEFDDFEIDERQKRC